MKLYATTTSERASKVQGGNEYLAIEIKVENEDIAYIFLDAYKDGEYVLKYKLHRDADAEILTRGQLKGGSTICADRACKNQAHGHSWMR